MTRILLLIFLLSVQSFGALVVTNITITPTGQGGMYTTLKAAEDGEDNNGDLVSRDIQMNFVISGTWSSAETAAIAFAGYTTDATRYICITNSGSKHGGKWNANAYNLTVNDTTPLTISEDYVIVDGIQVSVASPTGNGKHIITSTSQTSGANKIQVKNCILKGHNDGTYTQVGFYPQAAGTTAYLINSIVFGINATPTGNRCLQCTGTGTIVTVANSTLIGGYQGVYRTSGTCTNYNVYAGGAGNACFSGTIEQFNCASSDATAAGTALDSIAVNTTQFVNVTGGSEDFHLASGSALIDVGAAINGTAPLDFANDIDGVTRSGTWDIGADEYVSTATATKPTTTYLLRGILR